MHSHNSYVVTLALRISWFLASLGAIQVGLMPFNISLLSYLPAGWLDIVCYIIGAAGIISLISIFVSLADDHCHDHNNNHQHNQNANKGFRQ